jgi:hypothetical protein
MTNKNKRKNISKKIRFEVLKRDKFACQYCGAKAPDVLLHIDHINPVSIGGDNDIMNLTTSCEACNFGKSDKRLDDNSVINKQRTQLEELQDRREQIELMMAWQHGLKNLDEEKVGHLCEYWHKLAPGFTINDNGKKRIKQLLRKISVEEIIDAMNIASERYLVFKKDGRVTDESWNTAYDKISGICYMKRKIQEKPELEDLYKIKSIAKNNCNYFDDKKAQRLIEVAMSWDVPVDALYKIARNCRNWTIFRDEMNDIIDEYYEDDKSD